MVVEEKENFGGVPNMQIPVCWIQIFVYFC